MARPPVNNRLLAVVAMVSACVLRSSAMRSHMPNGFWEHASSPQARAPTDEFDQLMSIAASSLVDHAVEGATSLAQTEGWPSILKDGSLQGKALCSEDMRKALKTEFVMFRPARPKRDLCREFNESRPLAKTKELATKYFKFLGSRHTDPMKVIAQARFYHLPSFDAAYSEKIAGEPLPGLNATLPEVLSSCFANSTTVLRGGAVRDLFIGKSPTDIDIDWEVDTDGMVQCMRSKFKSAEYVYKPNREYVKWGEKSAQYRLDPLEGFAVKPIHSPCSWENSVNGLMYDPTNRVVIDPTGYGVRDVCHAEFRLPPQCRSPETWMGFETKHYRKYAGLRYAKMLVKGFKWANPDEDLIFLTRALNAQVKAEGKGLKGKSVDLIQAFYEKFHGLHKEALLFAHRMTMFRMMDLLCGQVMSLQNIAVREEMMQSDTLTFTETPLRNVFVREMLARPELAGR